MNLTNIISDIPTAISFNYKDDNDNQNNENQQPSIKSLNTIYISITIGILIVMLSCVIIICEMLRLCCKKTSKKDNSRLYPDNINIQNNIQKYHPI